ncbi:MAG: hypothetical protein J6B54_02775 [Clostridia bacterium]|nr:hypothetical protein [Clostridia bacterium]
MTHIRIHPTILLAFLFPLFGILTWEQTGWLWISAFFHEAAHIAAYRICGTKMERIVLLPFGICAGPQNPIRITPASEVFCAAAGPTANLLITVLLLALPVSVGNETVRYLLYCNGALFLVNGLPILPLDGGRMVYYGLATKYDAPFCERICYRCALILLILLLFPVCFTLFKEKNPSLAMIWGYLAVYTTIQRGSI